MVILTHCKKKAWNKWRGPLLILAGTSGCGLDEFRPADAGVEADAGGFGSVETNLDGGQVSSSPPCEPGAHRCEPESKARLQVCDPLAAHGWVTIETCDDPAACDAELGRCRSCTPGEVRCSGWRLEECNEQGTGWSLLEECAAPEYCDSRAVQCATCLPNEAYCSGSTLLSCNQNRDGYVATECDGPDQCNIASMSCRECVPGELQCNAESLVRCSEERSWEIVEVCEGAALCQLSLERQHADPDAEPRCADPVCEPGTFQCSEHDGRTLLGCPPDGDGWRTLRVCATADACNAESGECDELACTPGSLQCNGTTLELCAGDGSRWETLDDCESPGDCNTTEQKCVACEPGMLQCSGDELQRCVDGTSWETVETCGSPTLCQVDAEARDQGGCREPACAPGEYRCSSAGLELCDAGRDGFTAIMSCSSAELCNAADGRCDVPACPAAGAERCRGNQLERCSDDRSRWELIETCLEPTVCDLESSGCAESCPDQRFRCNGLVPEECVELEGGGLVWEAVAAPCATEGLCNATDGGAECLVPVCGGMLGTFRCDPARPARIQRCSDDRSAWVTERTCAPEQTCDPGPDQQGPAQCDVCQAETWACNGGVLTRCEPDGQRQTTLETCRSAEHCIASATEGFCLRCDEGETLCNAGDLDICADDRRSFIDFEDCEATLGCQRSDQGNDYCNACATPGEPRCKGDALEICDEEQRTIAQVVDCPLGCQTVTGPGDYCRECEPNTAECSEQATDRRLVCSGAGLWDEQACAGGSDCFDAGTADYCGSCDPGSYACTGPTQRQRCAENGAPGAVESCPSTAPVCLAATNECVACAPGSPSRCSGEPGSSGREVCDDRGRLRAQNCGGATPVCVDGACLACLPGEARCSGNGERGRQLCSAGGSWQTANCGAPLVCLDGACAECNPMTARPRCTASGGAGRQVCTDGAWTEASCADDLVCVEGECLECDPASQAPQCLAEVAASARRVCEDGQWSRDDCASPTPVCNAGSCVCDDDETRCAASGMRQRCEAGAWVDAPCTGSYCQAGECLECRDDGDCSEQFPVCAEGACQCEAGSERCTDSGAHQVCSDGMWYGSSCGGETPQCDPGSGRCVCVEGAQRCTLGVREICRAGEFVVNEAGPECTSCSTNADCGGDQPICDGVACVACDDDCLGGAACSSSGACVECTATDTSACTPGAPVCSPAQVCVQCTPDDAQACVGTTPVCGEAETCRACANDAECGGELVCDLATGACVACVDSADCESPTPLCSDGECRSCETLGCASGTCDPESGACELCSVEDCTGVCEDGVCVPCSGLLCPDGRLCIAGECLACESLVDAGDETACPSGICIAGVCVL